MARFCSSCGAPMPDNANNCPSCGKAAAQSVGAGAAVAPAQVSAGGLADNIAGLLCYSPVGLIADVAFLVLEPYNKNKFIRFHAFQSLFLCGAAIVVGIGLSIVASVMSAIMPFLALIMIPVDMVIWLGFTVLFIVMMVKAYQNQTTHLPIIGDLADKQANA